MKTKLANALKALVKDYGLSDKAVNELAEQGASVIDDNATDEAIQQHAQFLSGIARITQGEVTRKVQAVKQPVSGGVGSAATSAPDTGSTSSVSSTTTSTTTAPTSASETASLMSILAKVQSQLSALQEASDKAAAARVEESRQAMVLSAAKRAGLSEKMARYYDTSKVSTRAEADAFFSEVKQELVNSNLRPKGGMSAVTASGEGDKAAAQAWAASLK